ncbi:neurogenic locus Notch protein-like [Littorina saxatilis]|uniref:neurogenic locus Notch protein-like n=1 Tax=Littorina saxatilis TaxID=31220 RepID=UPI0038B4D86C
MKGETCSSGVRQCLSGATCVPQSGGGMVCQCTDNKNVNQETDGCESVANAAGGNCTDQSCSDPNAKCNNGICECIHRTTIENSNYTCGYAPGVDCRNNTNACNSGTFCDRNGQCREYSRDKIDHPQIVYIVPRAIQFGLEVADMAPPFRNTLKQAFGRSVNRFTSTAEKT